MTVKQLIESGKWEVVSRGAFLDEKITGVYCCDLLSIAMGKLKKGEAWVTIMANINTLAVAQLADAGCIILADGVALDEVAIAKAKEQEITVLSAKEPIFNAALWIYEKL